VFWVKATHSQRVRFVLTPTGTNVGPYAKLLGKDGDPETGSSWPGATATSR
jgi:hypothetical protein